MPWNRLTTNRNWYSRNVQRSTPTYQGSQVRLLNSFAIGILAFPLQAARTVLSDLPSSSQFLPALPQANADQQPELRLFFPVAARWGNGDCFLMNHSIFEQVVFSETQGHLELISRAQEGERQVSLQTRSLPLRRLCWRRNYIYIYIALQSIHASLNAHKTCAPTWAATIKRLLSLGSSNDVYDPPILAGSNVLRKAWIALDSAEHCLVYFWKEWINQEPASYDILTATIGQSHLPPIPHETWECHWRSIMRSTLAGIARRACTADFFGPSWCVVGTWAMEPCCRWWWYLGVSCFFPSIADLV